jgi:hypothetical protein
MGCDDLAFRLQANAAADGTHTITGIRAGLDEPDIQVIFLVIVLGDQRLGSFAGAHSTILKI